VQATPLYLSEMAPFKLRGALNIMFQVRRSLMLLLLLLSHCGLSVLTACKQLSMHLAADTGAVSSLLCLVPACMGRTACWWSCPD
jgi:hypothetical protein